MRKILEYSSLPKLANEHYDRINPKLKKPDSTGRCYKKGSVQFKLNEFGLSQTPLHQPFYSFLESKLEEIIISPPSKLLELHESILKKWLEVDSCLTNLEAKYKTLNEEVFDYDNFRNGVGENSRNVLWFNSLNLKACPYCNRNWITKVIDETSRVKLYFDIDHFFPKYKYPWFALSFYNLIPSCTVCNQRIKGFKELSIIEHIHPYMDDFDEIVKFHIPFDTLDIFFDKSKNIELTIIPRPPRLETDPDFIRAKEFYDFFNLKNLYNTHLDYIRELLQKRIVYSKSYVEQLKIDYIDIFKSEDEIPRMLFGNYVLPEQIHERPLAKLTKDLIEDTF